VLEIVQQRLDANPQAMRVRRETVLAYNLTRVMNLIGVKPLLAAIQA
jgi:hypothetical protein